MRQAKTADHIMSPELRSLKTHGTEKLTEVVCWSRMQAEAGQQLQEIIARKELERRAGSGLFFWGVGSAPARAIPSMAQKRECVDVVFSVMKSRPKLADVAPSVLYVWRRYVDAWGAVRILPSSALVTSRGEVNGGMKRRHYALMCQSEKPLALDDLGAFEPAIYRNVGGKGGSIGASQVTALLRRHAEGTTTADYRINMRARLTGSYWVCLVDPVTLSCSKKNVLDLFRQSVGLMSTEDWLAMVGELRTDGESTGVSKGRQVGLFY